MVRELEEYNYVAYKALLDDAFFDVFNFRFGNRQVTTLSYDPRELPILATAVDQILADMANSPKPLIRRQEEVLSFRYPMIISRDAPINPNGRNSYGVIAEVIQRTDDPNKFGVQPTAAKGIVTAGLKKVAKSIQENPNLRRFVRNSRLG